MIYRGRRCDWIESIAISWRSFIRLFLKDDIIAAVICRLFRTTCTAEQWTIDRHSTGLTRIYCKLRYLIPVLLDCSRSKSRRHSSLPLGSYWNGARTRELSNKCSKWISLLVWRWACSNLIVHNYFGVHWFRMSLALFDISVQVLHGVVRLGGVDVDLAFRLFQQCHSYSDRLTAANSGSFLKACHICRYRPTEILLHKLIGTCMESEIFIIGFCHYRQVTTSWQVFNQVYCLASFSIAFLSLFCVHQALGANKRQFITKICFLPSCFRVHLS